MPKNSRYIKVLVDEDLAGGMSHRLRADPRFSVRAVNDPELRKQLSGKPDHEVLGWARKNNRILITQDTRMKRDHIDKLLRADPDSVPPVVLLPQLPIDQSLRLVRETLPAHHQDLKPGTELRLAQTFPEVRPMCPGGNGTPSCPPDPPREPWKATAEPEARRELNPAPPQTEPDPLSIQDDLEPDM